MPAAHLFERPQRQFLILFFLLVLILAGLLIVWHAWKWPKPAEQGLPGRRPVTGPNLAGLAWLARADNCTVVTKPTAAIRTATPTSTRIPLRLSVLVTGIATLLPCVLSD